MTTSTQCLCVIKWDFKATFTLSVFEINQLHLLTGVSLCERGLFIHQGVYYRIVSYWLSNHSNFT